MHLLRKNESANLYSSRYYTSLWMRQDPSNFFLSMLNQYFERQQKHNCMQKDSACVCERGGGRILGELMCMKLTGKRRT